MKWGLGESYDEVQFITPKIRGWIDITKPASTLGVSISALLASVFFFYYTGQQHLLADRFTTVIFVGVTVGLAHAASQAMNMAEDAEMDMETEHKQNRPIPSGVVTEEEARSLAWIMILLAVGRAYMINIPFGIFITVSVVLGVFYNLEPIRAKERVISVPWQAVSRGLISFPMIWAAYGRPLSPFAWTLGLFMFFYVLGFQNSADIIDEEVDKKYGIKTFVVMFGVKRTMIIASGCVLLMMSVVMTGNVTGIIPDRHLSFLAIVPVCIIMLIYMWDRPYEVSDKTGNHPAWLWFYIGMVLTVLVPTVTEVVYKTWV